jgi:hypothetical protein
MHEMGVHSSNLIRNGAKKIDVQPAGRDLKKLLERLFFYCANHCRLNCACRDRVRLAGQQGRRAKETSRVDIFEDLLFTSAAGLGNLDRTFFYKIERIPRMRADELIPSKSRFPENRSGTRARDAELMAQG